MNNVVNFHLDSEYVLHADLKNQPLHPRDVFSNRIVGKSKHTMNDALSKQNSSPTNTAPCYHRLCIPNRPRLLRLHICPPPISLTHCKISVSCFTNYQCHARGTAMLRKQSKFKLPVNSDYFQKGKKKKEYHSEKEQK